MNVKDVLLVTFSPTRTSWRIGEAIARGTSYENVRVLDLTYETEETPIEVSAETLLVVAVPVYGGKVAPPALKRMSGLKLSGTPVVLVALYGNRAYEQALVELEGFITGKGGQIVAAGAFVGEHPYSVKAHPVAAGRPDVRDLEVAEAFGRNIRLKLDKEPVETVNTADLPDKAMATEEMLRFRGDVQAALKGGAVVPQTPSVDEALCNHCGTCVSQCPTQAIVEGEETMTIADRCIRCCACVKVCPQQARTFDTPFSALLSKHFGEQKENKILL
ncbi:MAG: 4Fe-4S binding protein [Bacteroides sp.]|nr:4Fe-4S binding protein [Bacteroides sp.]